MRNDLLRLPVLFSIPKLWLSEPKITILDYNIRYEGQKISVNILMCFLIFVTPGLFKILGFALFRTVLIFIQILVWFTNSRVIPEINGFTKHNLIRLSIFTLEFPSNCLFTDINPKNRFRVHLRKTVFRFQSDYLVNRVIFLLTFLSKYFESFEYLAINLHPRVPVSPWRPGEAF